jgi:hypothetical protein
MNYIKHLTGFFNKLIYDFDLNPTHVSLYIALFQFWNLNRFKNPISISRDEVMRISKIYSKATYHKCMRELHEKGYVIYEPSYNPFRGSLITMLNHSDELKPKQKREQNQSKKNQKNELVNEQVLNKHQTSFETSIETTPEQALVPSINNVNNTNNFKQTNNLNLEVNKNESTENLFEDSFKIVPVSKKKLREKKGMDDSMIIPPEWSNVVLFFNEKNATAIEAEKFFNHFQSNGWLVGGKSKMKDWKAAARNWMLNAIKFQQVTTPQPNHLHISNNKNYGEAL